MKAAATALAALLLAAGCKDRRPAGPPPDETAPAAEQPPPPRSDTRPELGVIVQVLVEVVDADEPRPLKTALLADMLELQLTQSPLFLAEGEPVPADRRGRRAEVELLASYDVVDGPRHGGASLVTTASLQLRWLDGAPGPEVGDDVLLERPLSRGDRGRLDELVREQVWAAAEKAGEGLLAREALRRGSDAEVIGTLASSDPHRLTWALTLAGERRLRAAVPTVAAKLDHDDAEVRDAAFTALVAIGDPSAVPALTRRVDFQDYDGVRAVIDAAAALGGSEAVAFLEFVAAGHPDPDIRARAATALQRGHSPARNALDSQAF